MLFDEPLTVIDPHLKWQLRRKLKQIHHELKLTLIYVTHDQVEALTFADQVVVMTRGRAVQIGSAAGAVRAAAAHLRRPLHRLAGHELPAGATSTATAAHRRRRRCRCAATRPRCAARRRCTLGVRPEYVTLADAGDAGRAAGAGHAGAGHRHLPAGDGAIGGGAAASCSARLSPDADGAAAPATRSGCASLGAHTCFYARRPSWSAEAAA